jgi:hypothetical protein|nr:MAG TPA: tail tape measure [Caudoviricetes sp.]
MTVEELNIVITATNRQFNEALDDIMSRLEGLEEQSQRTADNAGSIFTKLGGMLAGLGLGKIIGDSLTNGGELEQQLGGVEVVFSEHAEAMKKTAATAYRDMGLSEAEYLAKANKMGALFGGSGFDMSYAASMSQQVMQRAADVASIMGVDVKDAMEAVTGAAKGNFTMMDNLGVAMNDTTLQAYAQEKGLGKLETTQQKVSAAMQMFLDKTEYAAGNYARENDTFSGSLTTAKAQLENMTADLGTQLLPTATSLLTMARGGLEAISPLVVSLGNGLNSVAQYLIGLSPSAKTLLGIAVGAAVAIPAATKAHALWTAANEKWNSLLNILIPKEAKRANIMKAAAGWLVILAGLLSIVASVGATAREMNESEGAAMEDTAAGADKAAESTDSLSDSMAGLGKSADTTKKKLADIDTLNVFDSGSSTGGVDFSAIVDGAESAQDSVAGLTDDLAGVNNSMDELNNFSLDGLADTFSTTFGDIGTGFSTMWSAVFGSGQEQYDSLLAWNESIKKLWGEDWTRFWNDIGSTLYQAFGTDQNTEEHKQALRDVEDFLTGIQNSVESFASPIQQAAFKVWDGIFMSLGSALYSFQDKLMSVGATSTGDFFFKYITGQITIDDLADVMKIDQMSGELETLYDDMNSALLERLKRGMNAADALNSVKNDYLTDSAKQKFFDDNGYGDMLSIAYAYGLQQSLEETGQVRGYDYADYSTQQSSIPGAVYSGGAMTGPVQLPDSSAAPQIIEFHNYIDLDGQIIAENTTQYQNNEQTRSNGY